MDTSVLLRSFPEHGTIKVFYFLFNFFYIRFIFLNYALAKQKMKSFLKLKGFSS